MFRQTVRLSFVVAAVAERSAAPPSASEYEAHLKEFGISRAEDPVGHEGRRAIFEKRLKEIEQHNADPRHSWKMKRNHMADWTEAEFERLLGHRPRFSSRFSHSAAAPAGGASLLETKTTLSLTAFGSDPESWPESVDWSAEHAELRQVQNQGSCGGCWAAATAGAMQANALISGHRGAQPPSFEWIVSCAENPKHCGGGGGCSGFTAEGAMNLVERHGVPSQEDFQGYLSSPTGAVPKCDLRTPRAWGMEGYRRLPMNRYAPVMQALSEGTLVLSVDASLWGQYGGGVFDKCQPNAVPNHAVLGVGYGTDPESGLKYYLIRNSWSETWGEQGFIRLARHEGDSHGGDGHCGIDTNPKDGTACDGAPPKLPVCGMCGVLMDSAVPHNVKSWSELSRSGAAAVATAA